MQGRQLHHPPIQSSALTSTLSHHRRWGAPTQPLQLSHKQRLLYLPISLQLLPLLDDLQRNHKVLLPSGKSGCSQLAEGLEGARYT